MDDFSDDDFGDLNETALQELENNAIQFTQFTQAQPKALPTQANVVPENDYGDFEDDDLDDTVVIDESIQAPRPPIPKPQPRPTQTSRSVQSVAGQQRWNRLAPHDSNAALPSRPQYPNVSRPPPPLPQHQPGASRLGPNRPPNSQLVRPPVLPQPQRYGPTQQSESSQAHTNADTGIVAALKARLNVLEKELLSAKGEAHVLRSRYSIKEKEHDEQVLRLKKANADQLEKQKQLAEAASAAERNAATELQFTRQDLKDERDRTKKKKDGSGVVTPRKANRSWSIGDDFDDVDVMASPKQGRAKSGGPVAVSLAERTPTKQKRKRPVVDSPVMALETHSDDVVMTDDGAPAAAAPAAFSPNPHVLPFDFLMLVLDHCPLHGQPLTFDTFSRYSFPSDPSQTFASIIFQKLPQLGTPQDPMRLLADFSELIIEIWSRCLAEEYHIPIYDLVALISFTLQLHTISTAPKIIASLLPVAQQTIGLVAVPRFHSPDGDLSSHADLSVQQLYLHIPDTDIMALMYLCALGCLTSHSESKSQYPQSHNASITQFWKTLAPKFVMMMLSPKHPQRDFLGMLDLLCTSSLPSSIGPIPEENGPDYVSPALIDRLSIHLVQSPKWADTIPKQRRLRLTVLRTLTAFARSPYGAQQLASHDAALPRLVAVLCASIDALYDADVTSLLYTKNSGAGGISPVPKRDEDAMDEDSEDPLAAAAAAATAAAIKEDEEQPSSDEDEDADEDESPARALRLLHQLISDAMLLLHTLVTDPATSEAANMPARLAASHGAAQRYHLTLARLNFAEEDLLIESGIPAETIDLAHELLELAVTPDEGEGLGEVFGV